MNIFISHRGNINGRMKSFENQPNYIDNAISELYDVEVDVWFNDGQLFLGHDNPDYATNINWFLDRISNLWIHCKNIDAIDYFKNSGFNFNYFWHQKDDLTITSLGYFWTYPGKQLTKNSIAVLPEVVGFKNIEISYGVCSDSIDSFRRLYSLNN